MTWTRDRINTLKETAAAGGSYSDAAEALGITRDAVAGKARREGIEFSGLVGGARVSEGLRQYWARLTAAQFAARIAAGLGKSHNYRRAQKLMATEQSYRASR